MSEKFYTILTNIGKNKIANFAINGEEVKFVKLKVGDGNGKYYNPIENQKDLINTVWEGKIGNIQIDKDNPNWIVLEAIIPPEVGDFTIREYGAFDEEDNLLAISKCPETYKPTISNGSTKELIIKMILSVSNTESISFEVDPNIMLAKKSKVDEIDKKVNHTISQLKEIEQNLSQLINPNLLINGDFQVRQRGDSFTTSGYTVDRWFATSDKGISVTAHKHGVIIKNTEVGSWHNFETRIEIPSSLQGATLTFTIQLNNAYVYRQIYINDRTNNKNLVAKFGTTAVTQDSATFVVPNNCSILTFGIQVPEVLNAQLDIRYCKLELGSVATPFVPRNYGEELALCQRYYFRNGDWERHRAVTIYPTSMDFFIPLSAPMRIKPTINGWTAEFKNLTSLNNTTRVPIDSTNFNFNTNGFLVRCTTKEAHNLNDGFIELNGTFELDAEIY